MSTSLVSDFVEEVKGGRRRSCVAAFSHNSELDQHKNTIKAVIKPIILFFSCSDSTVMNGLKRHITRSSFLH